MGDNMTSFTLIWEKALKDLKSYYEANNDVIGYENYIKTLIPEFEEHEVLYFKVGNQYQKELVNQRFITKITESVNRSAYELTNVVKSYRICVLTSSEMDIRRSKNKEIPEGYTAKSSPLIPGYNFDTFVVGNANKLANAAAHAVAETPGQAYNPLFIYGGSGLGKTHLMHAIGNKMKDDNPNMNIIYTTSESFMIEFVDAMRTGGGIEKNKYFRNKYRNTDVLLIDDIQFISKGPGTQEELFHTFNALYEEQKQIVISSDKLPSEIPNLEERLLSRFQWGLLVDIGMPDYETRVAILKNKIPLICAQTNCTIPIDNEVVNYIASKDNTNVRVIESALKKVIAQAKLNSLERPINSIDLSIAEEALRYFFNDPTAKDITPKLIIKNVCDYYEVTEENLMSEKRNREIAFPRQICMYLMRFLLNLAYPKIGELLGGRHYSTVIHADEKISAMVKTDADLKKNIDNIIHRIKE